MSGERKAPPISHHRQGGSPVDPEALDLVVIGAGPCGLAVVSRLARDAGCCGCADAARLLLRRTRVVDPHGAWLTEWRRKLGSQGVAHLRSPSFVHPHPSRLIDDALRAYAHAEGRTAELAPLPCGGWAAPSAALFEDFCAQVARDFCGGPLEGCLMRGRVLDVRAAPAGGFELSLEGGGSLRTRRVVLALGDGGLLRVPRWLPAADGGGARVPPMPSPPLLHATHLAAQHTPPPSAAPPRRALAAVLLRRAAWLAVCLLAGRPRWLPLLRWLSPWATGGGSGPAAQPLGRGRLVVVGGGLSAAQLAIHACRSGWRRVLLLLRDEAPVRPFDIDEEWMGRHLSAAFSPLERDFYRADPPARRGLLRQARPGGSLTPASVALLAALQRRGGLQVRRDEVVAAAWRDGEGWALRLRGAGGAAEPERCDALWLATGHELDAARLPLVQSVLGAWPRPLHGGLPELTPGLRWADGLELYVAGTLSALQIGPDAFNLAGCAAGAARISSDIYDGLSRTGQ